MDKKYKATKLFGCNDTNRIKNSKAKDFTNKSFNHYTSVSCIKDILSKDEKGNRFFFVKNIKNMNDQIEAELHKKDGNRVFCFCTCNTNTERIPLWYLYGGICGDGGRIRITPAKMLGFINSISTVYPVIENHADYDNPLKIDDDFELQCGWVYYTMEGKDQVLYRNRLCKVKEMTDELLQSNYFIKEYPWNYEGEFRIIIINKTNNDYDRIAIPVPDSTIKIIEIMSAPEYSFEESEKIGFVSCGINKENIRKSKLRINMNLFERNKAAIMAKMEGER